MSQIPIHENTYSRLSLLKSTAIINKNGSCVIWDDVVSAMSDVVNNHKEEFLSYILRKKGKAPKREVVKMVKNKLDDIKEAVADGEKVTSEQLEELGKRKRFAE